MCQPFQPQFSGEKAFLEQDGLNLCKPQVKPMKSLVKIKIQLGTAQGMLKMSHNADRGAPNLVHLSILRFSQGSQ